MSEAVERASKAAFPMTHGPASRERVERVLAALSPGDPCGPSGSCVVVSAERLAELKAQVAKLGEALVRIDVGLTKAIKSNNFLVLDDMATQARDMARSIGGEG